MDIVHIGKCRYEIQEQEKFRYGTPAYTGPFLALPASKLSAIANFKIFLYTYFIYNIY
jgi:hypothetical protein